MTANAGSLPAIPERRYERPPIVEALCEMYFAGSHWDPTLPGLFYEKVRTAYPEKSQLAQGGIELQISPGQAPETRQVVVEPRMRFARRDNSRLLQVTRDLLILNQLLPYPHYEEWRDELHSILDIYRELAAPTGIVRLGMRYINSIKVPRPLFPVEDYFRVYPEIPPQLGPSHGFFMLQVQMPPVCTGHQLTLTLGTGPPQEPGTVCFLLDLYDVIQLAGRDAFGEVGRLMDEAHANIVHTFENTITDNSRKLFGEITRE
jgi:uncharacterized protein (TIGR04255 family)